MRTTHLLLTISLAVGCVDSPPSSKTILENGVSDAMVVDGRCATGQTRCVDGLEEVCGQNGLWVLTNRRGDCEVDLCADATRNRSYIGCEYWPIDLDNAIEVEVNPPQNGRCDAERANSPYVYRDDIPVCSGPDGRAGLCDAGQQCPEGYTCQTAPACILDAQGSPFCIVVSNPSDTTPSLVTLSNGQGQMHQLDVAPNAVEKIYPYELGFPDNSIDRTSLNRNTFKLTASAPIVAYQFNPLDNVGVFSNDGSLLIPEHALDSIYYVLTVPTLTRRPDKNDYSGYVTIVGTAEANIRIRVTPTGDIRAGDQLEAMPAGVPVEFDIGQGQVLNLEAGADQDLTGTRIESVDGQSTFAVFVGHEASILTDRPPRRGLCCADHIEEQLFPASSWGSRFAIARTVPRPDRTRNGQGAPDMIRILAQKPNTEITFDPPVNGNCPILEATEFCDIFIDRDTTITSSQPILVGHFLLSTDGRTGDPALAFVPPFEQFREAYTFLVPDEYNDQFISVAAFGADEVYLDGTAISDEFDSIAANWYGARVRVTPGQHTLTCPGKCGLLVYGYSPAVSYLFAGGLDLEAITLP